ncbi:hypothetical protein ACFL1G_02760 [Planctomycetota bacterium]
MDKGIWEVFDGTSWGPAKGVSGIEVHESIPLTEEEIEDLRASGILSQ